MQKNKRENGLYKRTMIPFPNNAQGRRQQLISSIIVGLVGIFLMFSSVPFVIQFGNILLLSTVVGFIIFIVAVAYFLEGIL